jgi:hypothetical protein
MKVRIAGSLVAVVCLGVVYTASMAGDVKSGPDKKYGGAFDVKAITGDLKGKTLCYV